MHKVKLFAVSAAMLAIGVAIWATSPTNARAPSLSQGIDPHHMMTNASVLPAIDFADYTFVFN
jgi:hypothetical protein